MRMKNGELLLNRRSSAPAFSSRILPPISYFCSHFKKIFMFRTHTCGELRLSHAGTEVTLAGWVQTVRKFGSITFIDLRDRYGITQALFGEELNAQLDASPLGREFVLQVKGKVVERSNKNLQLPTGEVEIAVFSFSILNRAVKDFFDAQMPYAK